MTTTSFPFPLPSFPPPPSPTGSGPLSNTSNLLFGFLVSALSIFAVFMSCAIVWNRLVARRRAIEDMLATKGSPESQGIRRPVIWDVRVMLDKQLRPWLDVKPVAAQIRDCSLSSVQGEEAVSFWRRRIWDRLPLEITYLFHRPSPELPSVSNDTDVELLNGSDIQISVLISMPRAPQPEQDVTHEDRRVYYEMAFATTNIVCHEPS